MKNGFLGLLAAGLMGGGVTAGLLLGTGAAGDRATRTVVEVPPLGAGSSPVSERSSGLTARAIYELAAPAVVLVRARSLQSQSSPFDAQRTENLATGSGFVISRKGHLVTNAHIVSGATDIRVTFPRGKTVEARLMGKDEDTDLALLGVEPEGLELRPLTLGSSSAVEIGDPTVAIGSPFGLEPTLTTGVVAAKQRRITAPSGFSIENVIQTDAVVSAGNSGGPLLDASGRVIGISSQIATSGGGTVGFAVPVDTARALIPDLEAHHMVSHAYLGVRGGDAADSLVTLDDSGRPGVRVREVDPDGPAARAGILGEGAVAGGDVILAVDGHPVRSMADVDDIVSRHRPGDGLAIDLLREGSRLRVQAQLSERPASVPLG